MLQKSLVGLLILLVVYLLMRLSKGNSSKVKNVPDNISDAFDRVFDNSPYKLLKENWLSVSKMETAGWKSNLFREALNLWGMMKARIRPTTATGIYLSGREWSRYTTVEDAVKDILLWMDYTNFPRKQMSIEQHIQAMKDRGYFEEPIEQYLEAVKAWTLR